MVVALGALRALTEEGPLVLTSPDGGKAKLAELGIVAAPDPLG